MSVLESGQVTERPGNRQWGVIRSYRSDRLPGDRYALRALGTQICVVKNIIRYIEDNRGNGYIWQTAGSG